MTDFGNGADRIDLSGLGVESVDEAGMTLTADGVVVDLSEFDGERYYSDYSAQAVIAFAADQEIYCAPVFHGFLYG